MNDKEFDLLTKDVSNRLFYFLCDEFLTSNDVRKYISNNSKRGFLTKFVRNLTSPNGLLVAHYFYQHGASTIPEIVQVFGLDWTPAWRIVKKFEAYDIISDVSTVKKPYAANTGKPVSIFATKKATPQQVSEAQIRYGLLRSPNAMMPQKIDYHLIKQIAVDFSNRKELDNKDIINRLKEEKIPGYLLPHYNNEICTLLEDHGITIWK